MNAAATTAQQDLLLLPHCDSGCPRRLTPQGRCWRVSSAAEAPFPGHATGTIASTSTVVPTSRSGPPGRQRAGGGGRSRYRDLATYLQRRYVVEGARVEDFAWLPVGVDRRPPRPLRQREDRRADPLVDRVAQGERIRVSRHASASAWLSPAESERATSAPLAGVARARARTPRGGRRRCWRRRCRAAGSRPAPHGRSSRAAAETRSRSSCSGRPRVPWRAAKPASTGPARPRR